MTSVLKNEIKIFGKRTVTQVKSILKSNNIICDVQNTGDGRTFEVKIDSNIKNRYALKKAGFILQLGSEKDNFITFKAY